MWKQSQEQNFMDLAYEDLKDYHVLHAYVEEHYQEGFLSAFRNIANIMMILVTKICSSGHFGFATSERFPYG